MRRRTTPQRLTSLALEHEVRMGEWAERWTAVGLSTRPADWDRFEEAARACYRFAGLAEPKAFIRVPSPMVLVFAGPTAAYLIEIERQSLGRVSTGDAGADASAVGSAVDSAVDSA